MRDAAESIAREVPINGIAAGIDWVHRKHHQAGSCAEGRVVELGKEYANRV
jgi:hypothetical protein